MDKSVKMALGVVIFFAIISGIFLLTSKKKSQTDVDKTAPQTNKVITATSKPVSVAQAPKQLPAKQPAAKAPVAASGSDLTFSQWQQCKSKTLANDKALFWNVQILESIPSGGTYAKGLLGSNKDYPVHVIIKSGIQNPDQIKSRLAVGKTAFLRGTCAGVATDGSVVLQAF